MIFYGKGENISIDTAELSAARMGIFYIVMASSFIFRHCERSEAILFEINIRLLRSLELPRNDECGRTHSQWRYINQVITSPPWADRNDSKSSSL